MTPVGHTVLLSLWRGDAQRDLVARAAHLRAKIGVTTWRWIVGDSDDETEQLLRECAHGDPRVRVDVADTGLTSDAPETSLLRRSLTCDAALDRLAPDVDRVVFHESDLESSIDVVLALDGEERAVVAGWVTLDLGGGPLFYDTWAYRGLDGTRFAPLPPYHPDYRPDARFPVRSAGSVLSVPGWVLHRGARCGAYGLVGLSAACRARGVSVLVDPRVPIVQPASRWRMAIGASLPATV
jgi:hypothetical protein